MDYGQRSVELHRRTAGKIAVVSKVPLESTDDLALAYTPGVGQVSLEIAADKGLVNELTARGNLVAVVSDGSAVLGLGNIGPEAALAVMEGKAVLFKELGGVDAFPICLATHDADEIVGIVRALVPTFGGINLEDIAAPQCFEIEERLQDIGIPVFHDDQHGTAIVTLAALTNALKVTGRRLADLKIVFAGAGAAGIATCKLLHQAGACNLILVDTKGAIHKGRKDLTPIKAEMAELTNPEGEAGKLQTVLRGADVYIGESTAGLLLEHDIRTMNRDPIVFAMANPVPEIMPEEAHRGGAAVVGTGRSDFPNQINNVLAFPGVFRGALD
ncbi:MAG: NADP-dependent malic enzyme, partial [Chloroflexi bacterium]|nr:NADP-dependent malic enzyme [Chloroflexota bacterium]